MMKRLRINPLALIAAALLLSDAPTAQAKDTITIGKGSGILWAGFNGDVAIYGKLEDGKSMSPEGYAALSDKPYECIEASKLKEIAGVLAYEIAPGVGIAPRIRFYSDVWQAGFSNRGSISGNFTTEGGSAEIRGNTISHTQTLPLKRPRTTDRQWCFTMAQTDRWDEFLERSQDRYLSFRGHWVIVADGTQKMQRGIRFPDIHAASFTPDRTGNLREPWFPAGTTLRISTLECNIDTPRDINFGDVPRNLNRNAELAVQTVNFNVDCTQDVDIEDTNIEVRFNALSGLHKNSEINKLAFGDPNGAYLTGTLSGEPEGFCGTANGVKFDTTPLDIGIMGATDTIKRFPYKMTWRLCSGGDKLQTGEIKASAEVLVTFN
ncbi:hypothetical protein F3J27_00925 [Enterobacter sp. Ap-916]|uniref:hypothetical protein n=1 Tax=Enterobacteriaceae TaxID=543 RepID=UPI0014224678|nr:MULTISPECIES: hypothetical protein [unclassified Enterobacter]NIF58012.1 hypothetical protein [Enterobacter sp. Ap-867]NIG28046.1 hypothetical protein [Enterobacter sp. Ap-916]